MAAKIGHGKMTDKFLPPRILLYGAEGFGKTTIGAHTFDPFVIMVRGETGYQTLAGKGLVPLVNTLTDKDGSPTEAMDWEHLMEAISYVITEDVGVKTLVIDSLTSAECICHEFVCRTQFDGKWGEDGFSAWGRGVRAAAIEWSRFLDRLSLLSQKGISVLLIGHMTVRNYKNPTGDDFDRIVCDLDERIWQRTSKWVDAVLYGDFETIVDEDRSKRRRGIGGENRFVYTQHSDAWNAKNRYGMPREIEIPDDPAKSWSAIWDHIKPNRSKEKAQ